jgi:hypothetical protein
MKISNIELIERIPDILNFLIIIIGCLYSIIRFKINKIFLFYLIILLFPCFLLNDFLIDWTLFPDQSKYAINVYQFRNFQFENLSFSNQYFTSAIASLYLNFFPLPFVTTITSVSLINRGMFSLLILFFIKKKACPNIMIYLLLFMPSIIIFSSLALRESLILCISLLFFYYFFKRKYYLAAFLIFLLFFAKPHFALAYTCVSFIYFIFFVANIKKYQKLIFLFSVFFFVTIFFNQILHNLINIKTGFFSETYNYQLLTKPMYQLKLSNIDMIIKIFIEGLSKFILSPLKNFDNFFSIFLFIENIFLYTIIIISIIFCFKINKFKTLFWVFCIILFATLFGYLIENDGTLWRYKFQILVVFLYSIFFSIKKPKVKRYTS